MADALAGLIELLDLEPIEVNIFRGRSPEEQRQRVFGGQSRGKRWWRRAGRWRPSGGCTRCTPTSCVRG